MDREPQAEPDLKLLRELAAPDQLTPTPTPYTNLTMHGPSGAEEDVGDLAVELAVDPIFKSIATISAWELDDRQRALIAAGAHLRMTVWQHPIPPLALAIEAPFCEECGGDKVYVRAATEFACPVCDPRFREGFAAMGKDTPLDQAHADFRPADSSPTLAGDPDEEH